MKSLCTAASTSLASYTLMLVSIWSFNNISMEHQLQFTSLVTRMDGQGLLHCGPLLLTLPPRAASGLALVHSVAPPRMPSWVPADAHLPSCQGRGLQAHTCSSSRRQNRQANPHGISLMLMHHVLKGQMHSTQTLSSPVSSNLLA